MKKVGIVADNFKLPLFEKKLAEKGFTDYKIGPFTKESSALTINVFEAQVKDIHKICQEVEIHYKRSN